MLALKYFGAPCLWVVILLLPQLGIARAAELPSALECLPEQTFFMIRLPTPSATIQHFHDHTRAGRIWTDPKRWIEFVNLVLLPAQRDQIVTACQKYHLEGIGWSHLGRGEAGCAAVAAHDGRGVLFMFWLEPDTDAAERLATAADQIVDEWTRQDPSTKRVDIELPDARLVRVTWVKKHTGLESISEPDSSTTQKTTEKPKDDSADGTERPDGDPPAMDEVNSENLFFLRVGNRLAVAKYEWLADERHSDKETAQALDACQALLTQFVAAHSSRKAGALAKFESLPGITAVRPTGEPIVEAFVDPRTPLHWLLNLVDEDADDEELKDLIKSSAIDDLKGIGYRATFDQNLVRAEASFAVDEPHRGIWAAIDQSPLPPIDQNWIPADAVSVTQFSLNATKLYRQLLDMLDMFTSDLGADNDKIMEKVLQLPIPFLSSLGTRFTLVGFPSRPHAADKNEPDNPLGRQRRALVIPIKSTELWTAALQFAELLDGGKRVTEHGFEGLRFEPLGIQGGVFVGQQSLVVGIGDGVVEKTLSSLRSPPLNERAFVRSRGYRRACELLPPQPTIFYQFTDQSGTGELPRSLLLDGLLWLAAWEPDDTNELLSGLFEVNHVDVLKELLTAFPAGDFAGTSGVTVHQARMSEHGLKVHAVTELTRP